VHYVGAGPGITNSTPYKVHHITKFYEATNLDVELPVTPKIGAVSGTFAVKATEFSVLIISRTQTSYPLNPNIVFIYIACLTSQH